MTDAFRDHGIIVFDVDETLTLRRSAIIPPAIADLVLALTVRGTDVAICTARALDELASFQRQLERAATRARVADPVQIHLFPVCAAAGYVVSVCAGGARVDRLYALDSPALGALARDHAVLAARLAGRGSAWVCATDYPAPRRFWIEHEHGYVLVDRHHQITISFRQPADASAYAAALPAFLGEPVTVVRHGPHTLHVLPPGAGKGRSLRWLRERRPTGRALLVGDGFVGSAADEGGDMDLYHHRDDLCTCVQIGDEMPSQSDVVALPLPGSPAAIVRRMFAPGMTLPKLRRLSAALVEQRGPVRALARSVLGESMGDEERLRALTVYLLDDLEPAEVLDRLARCRVAAGPTRWHRIVPLLSSRLRDVVSRLGFAGNAALFLCWLWRELELSPHLRIDDLVAGAEADTDRARWPRAPILAEETPAYLLALAGLVAAGDRLFLVGKDAEPFAPALIALDRQLRSHRLVPDRTPALRVDQFRIDANRPIAEHITAMLPAEQASALVPVARRRAIIAQLRRGPELRARVERAIGECDVDSYFASRPLRAIVSDLADSQLDHRFEAAFELIRFKVDAQHRFFEPMFASDDEIDLLEVMAHYGDRPALRRLIDRYAAIEGTSTLDRERWPTLARLLIDVTWPLCAEVYGDDQPFAAPLAPVLVEALADTPLRRFRDSTICFFDVGFGLGATMMLCRGIAAVLGAAGAKFAVARLPRLPPRTGCCDPSPVLERTLAAWCSDSVAPEEERPSMLPIHYPGRRLEPVAWVEIMRELGHVPRQAVELPTATVAASRDRSEQLRRRHESQLDGRDAELAASGIDFHDVVRLWLRRGMRVGEIWQLYVLCDRMPFRDYGAVRRLQVIVNQVVDLLGSVVATEHAAELRRADDELWRPETLALLERWTREYERERCRERAGIASLFATAELRDRIAAYLREPTQTGFLRLRDDLVAHVAPSVC